MPNKPTSRELALDLELTTKQVATIMRLGKVKATTRRKTLDAIKAVELTLTQASEIWGFSPTGGMLKRHAKAGKLKVCNRKPFHKYNPRRVTVAAMIELMDKLNRPVSGFCS